MVGLASGITAGAASLVPDIKSLKSLSWSPRYWKQHAFSTSKITVLDDGNICCDDDGRISLLGIDLDVVVSEPQSLDLVSICSRVNFWEMSKHD